MKQGFRKAHLVVATLILAGIVVEPFLYLFGAVHTSDLHATVGHTVSEGGIVLLLVTGLLARLPRTEMILTLLLMVDLFLQVLLVGLRATSAVLAALHPLNAFALLLIAITIIRRDLVLIRGGVRQPGAAAAGPTG
jgi:hypothetical protein